MCPTAKTDTLEMSGLVVHGTTTCGSSVLDRDEKMVSVGRNTIVSSSNSNSVKTTQCNGVVTFNYDAIRLDPALTYEIIWCVQYRIDLA